MFTNLENILANLSFVTLFFSVIFYWIQTSNIVLEEPKTITPENFFVKNICLMILLLLRWKESGHFPLSNLYESLMFLSWSFTLIHLFIEQFIIGKFIGCITSPIALFTNAFATLSLPKEMQGATPLVPALQSNWLMMHVTVMILSYAALILGSLLSIAFLILTSTTNSTNKEKESIDKKYLALYNVPHNVLEGTPNIGDPKQKLAKTLDNLSYRILGIGFPFLTIGILSGAVWANEAWGSYWSWDPKETWALLTWLVFAIYLHTRLTKGWVGKKPAIIASLGFVTVWICFLGVNLIGEGLHSYGWLVKS
uniref:Cytochrome c biogenesis protein CcsA n=1 Tax=Borodinellopsis insignis TaxID=3229915 RepID=A0AB39A662_9CHLO